MSPAQGIGRTFHTGEWHYARLPRKRPQAQIARRLIRIKNIFHHYSIM